MIDILFANDLSENLVDESIGGWVELHSSELGVLLSGCPEHFV